MLDSLSTSNETIDLFTDSEKYGFWNLFSRKVGSSLLAGKLGKKWGFICYYILRIVSDSNSCTYLGFINSFYYR